MTGRNREVLRRWCADGTIPGIRVGRAWAITAETVLILRSHAARSRPRFDLWVAPDATDSEGGEPEPSGRVADPAPPA